MPQLSSTTPPSLRRAARARPRGRQRRRWVAPLLFIIPAVVLFGLFFLWPGALGLYYSFTYYRVSASRSSSGWRTTSTCSATTRSTRCSAAPSSTPCSPCRCTTSSRCGIAVLLTSRHAAGKPVARIIFFLPWLISPIVTGVIWRWLFGENFGFVNYVHRPPSAAPPLPWETNADLSLVVMLSSPAPGRARRSTCCCSSRRCGTSRSPISRPHPLDGATAGSGSATSSCRCFAPTSFMVILLSTIGAMKEFAMIQALNGGGPGSSNILIVQYIYQTGFQRARIGYASAVSMVLMVILMRGRSHPDAVREKEGRVKNAARVLPLSAVLWLLVVVFAFPAAVVPAQLVQAGQRAVLTAAATRPGELDARGLPHRLDAVRLLALLPQHRPSWRSPRPCSPSWSARRPGTRSRSTSRGGSRRSSSASWPPRCCRPR